MTNDRMNEYYSQLEGYKIKKYLGEGDDGFPAFLLTAPHYKDIKIEVSRDPEGNDGGFLFIGDANESASTK